jgi:hypothetical protein
MGQPGGSGAPSTGDLTQGAPQGATQDILGYNLGPLGGLPVYTGTSTTPGSGNINIGAPLYGHPQQSTKPTTQYLSQTAQDYVTKFATLQQSDPAAFAALQAQLYAANAYGSNKPITGVYSADDAAAMNAAIVAYERATAGGVVSKISFTDWLKQQAALVKAAGGPGGGGPARAPLVIQYTDPAELKEGLNQKAQEELGRNLSDKEVKFFVNFFHGKEAGAQRSAYNGASSVTPPEVTGEAQSFVLDNNDKEVQQRLQATYLDSLNSMLGVK